MDLAGHIAESSYGFISPEISRITGGRVNQTFRLTANGRSFILQQLHPVFGLSGAVVENTAQAALSMSLAGLPAPLVQPTIDGRQWVEKEGLWRLVVELPGRPATAPTVHISTETARMLGRFHKAMVLFPPELKPLPPAEHNVDGPAPVIFWKNLLETWRKDDRFARVEPILARGYQLAASLPSITPVTHCVVHGDPKLENILFDENDRAISIIDLDTVRSGSLIWELADALRSWATHRPPVGKPTLYPDIWAAAVASYKIHGLAMTAAEWNLLPQAVQAVCLNLSRRYLQDYFEQTYFAWDRAHYPSPAVQNLTRGVSLIDLADQIVTPGVRPTS